MLSASHMPASRTNRYNDLAGVQLRALCEALGMQASYPDYLLLQRFLFGAWGNRTRSKAASRYPSLIGDDHSPYEYSVAFTKNDVELRLLLESQATRPTLQANHRAALELNQRIAEVFPIDLGRLNLVADLFFPSELRGAFSLWHAVSLRKGRPPKFKVYLNPQSRGRDDACRIVYEALRRLGLGGAVDVLREEIAHRGPQQDEINYFSLDLSDAPSARVKVYFCHHRASARELERSFSASAAHVAGDVADFCVHMAGHVGPFVRKPVTSCFSFTGASERPHAATFHLPIAHYAPHDQSIADRIIAFMHKHGLNAARYAELLPRFARRPLADGVGVQSYASFRRDPAEGMLLTTYLSPELFAEHRKQVCTSNGRMGHVMSATTVVGFSQPRQ